MTNVLLAIENDAEISRFRQTIEDRSLDWKVRVPESVRDADEIVNAGKASIIVTDFHFQNGGFAEWLFLWQHPYVVIADWSEYEKLREAVVGQTSDFVIRDAHMRHIEYLPLVIEKVLHTLESVQRHNVSLRMTEERYLELVNALPDIVYSLDGDGRFVYINNSVTHLGYDPASLIGKHFSSILDESCAREVSRASVLEQYRGRVTGAEDAPKLFDERRTGERRTRDLEVILRPGNQFASESRLYGAVISYGEVNAVGFTTDKQDPDKRGSVGIIRDITRRKETEQLLRQSLNEKETLLAEIHHRVKNNLQVISSLLNLQSGAVTDEEALRRFADAQIQIQSMALVHEHLYQSETFATVDIERYVRSLCANLFNAFAVSSTKIKLEIDVAAIPVSMEQAMPIALLLNELLSNSIKYAFPGDRTGTIRVTLREDADHVAELGVADDGVGFPESGTQTDRPTLGHSLVHGLAAQLEGSAEFRTEDGAVFTLRFPLKTRTA